MLQELIPCLPPVPLRMEVVSSESALATKGVVMTGLVPLEKVHSPINPGKVSKRESYTRFKLKHPILSKDDYVCRYKGVSEEIVEKVVEGFHCLVEIYHLYGMKRPEFVVAIKDYRGPSIEEYFNKYSEMLEANHLYKFRIHEAITKLLCYLEESGDSSLWVSYFKYKTCAFFAFFEGQEIPPAPAGLKDRPNIIVFPSFVNYLKRHDQIKFRSFLMSINQSKMGMPRDCESSVARAEEKCARHLTTIPPPLISKVLIIERPILVSKSHLSQDDIDFHEKTVIDITKDSICVQLKRTVREMFKDATYTRSHHYEPFYPSTSSNYNRTRGQLGAVGEVMSFIQEDEELRTFLNEELLKLGVSEVKFREEISRKYGTNGIEEQLLFDQNVEHEVSGQAINFFDQDFKTVWCQLFDKLFEKAYIEDPCVEPLGLLEALKIRVISKGPPFLYTVLKPLQKFLWGCLKKNTVFTLIGTPITEELINKVIGKVTDEEILVNGDYKASTDNLHSWVSECLANEICDLLNENLEKVDDIDERFPVTERHREMLIRSLIHHKFYIDNEWKDQMEGQLMGSITSFPFLCLANAAFCRWALELADNKEYRLVDEKSRVKRAPLLINGDDCTLRGNRLFLRKCWEEITSFGGLTSSVGKTFFSLPSHPICMINSVAFDYDLTSSLWKERKYVNMGILLGKKRSIGSGQQNEDQVAYGELGVLHHELFRQAPPEIWEQVSSRFVYYNANTLKKYKHIPWDMPEYLGGPGLVSKEPMKDVDLECATLLIMNMKNGGGFHKQRLAVGKSKTVQEWQLHQLVAKRLEPLAGFIGGEANFKSLRSCNAYEYQLKQIDELDLFQDLDLQMNELCPFESLEDNYSRLYKYVVIESLFRSDIIDVHKPKGGVQQYHRNEWLLRNRNDFSWRNAYEEVSKSRLFGVKVRTQQEIMHEKKGFVIPVVMQSIYQTFYNEVVLADLVI